MKKIIFFSAIALLALVTLGCEKEEKNWTSLPPETQEGKNTIGCLIDGKLWATNHWGLAHIMYANIYASFYSNGYINGDGITVKDSMYVSIHAIKKNRSGMLLIIKEPNIRIEQQLNGELYITPFLTDDYASKEVGVYLTKFDTINNIISGRFSCNAINKDNIQDTVIVTDGRFDIRLTKL